ncbi:GNAT family N-acetyltransferase [Labrys wisconsinensis]|uniref:Acetyltransferase n=1 Tax=Labrys wisconsinensis TaxID=425677 RepID=A0ABU0J3P7_9HYPH|nr:N-acetyltransferase [Labrys wisconsinensis]MDQ0468859.1 putative acetyltransferase [Labrys wisconsinensis]
MHIRDEEPQDAPAIRAVVAAAFEGHPHGAGTEHLIVDALRARGAMTLSLVAEEVGAILGHVAFSPVTIGAVRQGWYGLGPLAVRPGRQRGGIGQALVRAGLERLAALGAKGCVLVGDPAYYRRFGFRSDPGLAYADVPRVYVLARPFAGETPRGSIDYDPAFAVTA